MNTVEAIRQSAAARLDRRVSNRLLSRFRRHLPEVLIQRALREAREVAMESGWPLLVFPLLAEETVGRMMDTVAPSHPALAHAA